MRVSERERVMMMMMVRGGGECRLKLSEEGKGEEEESKFLERESDPARIVRQLLTNESIQSIA